MVERTTDLYFCVDEYGNVIVNLNFDNDNLNKLMSTVMVSDQKR